MALKATAARRFGHDIVPAAVSVLIKSDPGVNPEAVRVTLLGARENGFVRFGFADPRLGTVVQQVAATPAGTVLAAQ